MTTCKHARLTFARGIEMVQQMTFEGPSVPDAASLHLVTCCTSTPRSSGRPFAPATTSSETARTASKEVAGRCCRGHRRPCAHRLHGHASGREDAAGGAVPEGRGDLLRQSRREHQAPVDRQRHGVPIAPVRRGLQGPGHQAPVHPAVPPADPQQVVATSVYLVAR